MNIKTFLANSPQEALRMVKEALGPEAVILRTRKVDGSRRQDQEGGESIEVTAAVDFEYIPSEGASGVLPEEGAHEKRWVRLESEIHQIKNLLWSGQAGATLRSGGDLDPEKRDRYARFRDFGLNADAIKILMPTPYENTKQTSNVKKRHLRESLLEVLRRIPLNGQDGGGKATRICAFIGPTGVGKTTTLAKLAALKVVREKKRVALVTLDTFRIAAVAQLATYARILGVPLSVAVNREEIRRAISLYRDYDAIFIDTAGRSPNNAEEISHLAAALDGNKEIHHYFLLSAATRYRDLVNAEKGFGVLPIKSYIITKLDEVIDASSVISFLISRPRPLSYFTTGQSVPEDIEPASRKRLAAMILGRGGATAVDFRCEGRRHGSSESAERHG